MKAIILMAGYATRLYPKTLYIPKALLEYKGRKILDYIMDDLSCCGMDEIILVSNHKFYKCFKEYISGRQENIRIIDDGSTSNENKLGAVNDLKLGLKDMNDDVLVMACDNLLNFSIQKFVGYYSEDKISSIMVYIENDKERLRRTGQAVLIENRVIDFKEKPNKEISHYAVPPFYIFNKEIIGDIKNIETSSESLGSIIESIIGRVELKAYQMPGSRIDFGN